MKKNSPFPFVLNFRETEEVKKHIWEEVTLSGIFQEIVYLARNDKIAHSVSESNLNEIRAIWFNAYSGKKNNDKFSVLLVEEAIEYHVKANGILTDNTIQNFTVTCNNVLLESMQGIEKPFVKVSSEDELKSLKFIKIT